MIIINIKINLKKLKKRKKTQTANQLNVINFITCVFVIKIYTNKQLSHSYLTTLLFSRAISPFFLAIKIK